MMRLIEVDTDAMSNVETAAGDTMTSDLPHELGWKRYERWLEIEARHVRCGLMMVVKHKEAKSVCTGWPRQILDHVFNQPPPRAALMRPSSTRSLASTIPRFENLPRVARSEDTRSVVWRNSRALWLQVPSHKAFANRKKVVRAFAHFQALHSSHTSLANPQHFA